MTITLKRTVNLSEPILPEVLPAPLYEGEKNAHTFMITAEKDKLHHALTGSVVAYFERNDGNTVRVEGETKDGAAILTLSPECYQMGVFYLAVMLIADSAQTVIYAASGRVRNTQDGEIIDGGNTVPTYDEIMAHLERYLSTDITAKVEETEDGARITMKDVVNGETTAVVKNGKLGENGATFRPTVSENGILSWTNDQDLANPEPVNVKGAKGDSVKVSRVSESTEDGGTNVVVFSDGATLRVQNGKTGAPGENGYTPVKNKDYFDGKDGYTPVKGVDYFDGAPGKNGYTPVKGKDYFDGEPGFSPTAKVTQIADGARIDITDKSGTTSAIVKNGKDGADAEGGGLPTGGEPHQMLVTDADGETVWEDRTHYSYEGVGDIVPEVRFFPSSMNDNGSVNIRTPATLEHGKTYTVAYNGNAYQCAATVTPAKPLLAQFGYAVDDSVMGGILGNLGVVNPSLASNEPFVLIVTQGAEIGGGYGLYGFFLPLDGSTSGSFAIRGMREIDVPIPKKYLTEARGQKTIYINTFSVSGGNCSAGMTFNEAWEMNEGELLSAIRFREPKSKAYCSATSVSKYEGSSNNLISITVRPYQDEVADGYYEREIHWLGDSITGEEMIVASPLIPYGRLDKMANLMQGDGLELERYGGYIGQKLALKTMSETTKGGAMVGKGLKMVGDALTVDEGEWELIESFEVEQEGLTAIRRDAFPDGTPYRLKAVRIVSRYKYPVANTYYTAAHLGNKNTSILVQIGVNIAAVSSTQEGRASTAVYQCKPVNGLYEPFGATGNQGGPMPINFPPNGRDLNVSTENIFETISINQYNGPKFPVGTTFEIYGVRA